MREGNICPNCFQETPESGTCRQCGFDRREEKKNPLGWRNFTGWKAAICWDGRWALEVSALPIRRLI